MKSKISLLLVLIMVLTGLVLPVQAASDASPNAIPSRKPKTETQTESSSQAEPNSQAEVKELPAELASKVKLIQQKYPKAHLSQAGDNKDKTRGAQGRNAVFFKRYRSAYEFFPHEIDKLLSGVYHFDTKGDMYENIAFGDTIIKNPRKNTEVYDTYTYDWVKKNTSKYFYMNKEGTGLYVVHPTKEVISQIKDIQNFEGSFNHWTIEFLKKNPRYGGIGFIKDSHSAPVGSYVANGKDPNIYCEICGRKRDKAIVWA